MILKPCHAVDIHFNNPDFVKYAKADAHNRLAGKADDLVSLLNEAFSYEGITPVACPAG